MIQSQIIPLITGFSLPLLSLYNYLKLLKCRSNIFMKYHHYNIETKDRDYRLHLQGGLPKLWLNWIEIFIEVKSCFSASNDLARSIKIVPFSWHTLFFFYLINENNATTKKSVDSECRLSTDILDRFASI